MVCASYLYLNLCSRRPKKGGGVKGKEPIGKLIFNPLIVPLFSCNTSGHSKREERNGFFLLFYRPGYTL